MNKFDGNYSAKKHTHTHRMRRKLLHQDDGNDDDEGDNFASDTHDELVADRNVNLSVT
jgi:hypothetical protein